LKGINDSVRSLKPRFNRQWGTYNRFKIINFLYYIMNILEVFWMGAWGWEIKLKSGMKVDLRQRDTYSMLPLGDRDTTAESSQLFTRDPKRKRFCLPFPYQPTQRGTSNNKAASPLVFLTHSLPASSLATEKYFWIKWRSLNGVRFYGKRCSNRGFSISGEKRILWKYFGF
jgi:hypothetical protein